MKAISVVLRSILPVLLISMLVLAAGCRKNVNTGTPQAPATPLHQLVQSSYDIASVLSAGEHALEGVYQAKLIDDEEARACGHWLNVAVQINEQYKARLQSLKFVDFSNKGQIIDWTNQVVGSLNTLGDQGIFAVKNPEAQTKLRLAFQGLTAILDQVRSIVGQIPDAPPAVAPKPTAQSQMPVLRTTIFTEVNFDRDTNRATHHFALAAGRAGSYRSHRADQPSARAESDVRRGPDRENDRDRRRHWQPALGVSGDAFACSVNARFRSVRRLGLFT